MMDPEFLAPTSLASISLSCSLQSQLLYLFEEYPVIFMLSCRLDDDCGLKEKS